MFVNQTGMGQIRIRIPRGVLPIRVPRVIRRRGGFGQYTPAAGQPLLLRPGPGGVGTEVVDTSGNIVYSADQVAANPSLANISSGGCPAGMAPTFYPGGQSQCAIPGAQGGTYIAGQPIGQCNDPSGLCFGSTFNGQTISTPVQLEAIPQGLPSIYTTPLTQPQNVTMGGAIPTTVTIQNTTRPGQPFQVGDSFLLTVTGNPNSPVSNRATQNGNSLGETNYGSTDANGRFSLAGSLDASTVGAWSESWQVGGMTGQLSFTVSAAPSYSGGAASGGGAPTGGSSASSAVSSSVAASSPGAPGCFSLLGALGIPDPCLGGLPIGASTLAAIALGAFLFFGGRR